MQIKYLTKKYDLEIKDLKNETVGALRSKIKEIVKDCSDLPEEKILLFHNKTKVSAAAETKLEEIQINNESTVFVVLIKTESASSSQAKASSAPQQGNDIPAGGFSQQATPNMFNNFGQMGMNNPYMGNPYNQMGMNNPYMGNPYGQMGTPNMADMAIEQQLFDQMLKDPDALLSMLENSMPNLPEDQKAMLKTNLEIMKKNPELVKQLLNNPGIMNAMRNPMASPYMGNPYMNMNNPYMGNGYPNMPVSPSMSPMMNNGFQNPYMVQMQKQAPPAPANGPCSHGFYPPRMVNGKPEPQDAEAVYAEKLNSLNEMGFLDKESNLKALVEAKGDISEAIDILSKKMRGTQ